MGGVAGKINLSSQRQLKYDNVKFTNENTPSKSIFPALFRYLDIISY